MFFSGDQSGDRRVNAATMRTKNPRFIIEHAVRGMLPKKRLADVLMRKLKVYCEPEHPHVAQNPIELK
jgi:large subunit ribosomal protein L13